VAFSKLFLVYLNKSEKGAGDMKAAKKRMEEGDDLAVFLEIIEEVEKDPNVKELMEENQREYGTLTEEDLKKIFVI
jgi:hypothetical protein